MENGTDSEFNTYPLLQEISDLLQTTLGKPNCFLKNLALLEKWWKKSQKSMDPSLRKIRTHKPTDRPTDKLTQRITKWQEQTEGQTYSKIQEEPSTKVESKHFYQKFFYIFFFSFLMNK